MMSGIPEQVIDEKMAGSSCKDDIASDSKDTLLIICSVATGLGQAAGVNSKTCLVSQAGMTVKHASLLE